MAHNKTQPTPQSVPEFIEGIQDEHKKSDCNELMAMMSKVTGQQATMWGPGIVGFGQYHYKYASGREGDFFLTGFSPRKQALTIYIISGFDIAPELMEKLGKYKTGKSCLYVKSLDDVDRKILTQLVKTSVAHMHRKYPDSRPQG